MCAWLFDYFVTSTKLEIRVLWRFVVYRLDKRDIVAAHVVSNPFSGALWAGQFGNHPWNTVRLGNRFRRRYVLVEKRSGFRFIAISPDDPELFVKLLRKPENGS